MQPLSQANGRILDALTEGLRDPGAGGDAPSSRKIDNSGGTYMPVHVERLGAARYSVAHYFEQNGDLVPDPDMEFVKQDGRWYPVAFQNQFRYTRALELDPYCETIKSVYRRAYADLRSFSGLLLKNIKHQQDVKTKAPKRAKKAAAPKEEIPFEGEDLGTLKIGRLEFSVEKREPSEMERKVNGNRPVYVLRGRRGAVYVTMRNRRNPDHMFLVNGRTFGCAMDGTWFTDEGGELRVR